MNTLEQPAWAEHGWIPTTVNVQLRYGRETRNYGVN